MKNKEILKNIASKNNQDSMVFDAKHDQFIKIPSHIDLHSETNNQLLSPDFRIQPFIKMIPFLNSDQVFQSPTQLELINTSGKNAKFVSENSFKSGVHFIELTCISDFKQVKVSLMKKSKKGTIKEYSISLGTLNLVDSVLLKIDLEKKSFLVIANGSNKGREVTIKGSNFQFMIELGEVGNFVTINPCYLYRGQNNTWTMNLNQFETRYLALLKNWVFLKNVDLNKRDSIIETLKKKNEENKEEVVEIVEEIYEENSKILAMKTNNPKTKMIKKTFENHEVISYSILKSVFKFVFQNGQFDGHLEQTSLIDFVTKHNKRFMDKPATNELIELFRNFKNMNIPQIEQTYTVKSNAMRVEYLSDSDVLLISNGSNKLKILKQRNLKDEFIVSPFIFDTESINFYLTKEEFAVLFQSLDWSDLFSKLYLTNKEVANFKSLFQRLSDKSSLVTDGNFYFFKLQESETHTLVEKVFQYLNLVIHNAMTFDVIDEEVVIETATKEKTEEENLTVDDHYNEGLLDLFNENQNKSVWSELDQKAIKNHVDSFFKNKFEVFPNEFDAYLYCIFKIEESLFLQSTHYRRSTSANNRGHTSFGRLFSYMNSHLKFPQIQKLIDFGIYINSTFLKEFKHYKHERYAYNDFNDQNVAELLVHSYEEQKANPHLLAFPNDNIELDFSISHMPCFQVSIKIKQVFHLQNGKFICVVCEDQNVILLTTKFGLSKVFQTNLGVESTWIAPKKLENILKNNSVEVGETKEEEKKTETNEISQEKPKTDETEKLIDKTMLEKLYAMGFPLDDCKTALITVKSSSLDDAINEILNQKQKTPVLQEPVKTKIFHLQLKPEWACKMCTLKNFVDPSNPTPEICEACGNQADKDAYFQETEEEKIISPPIENERVFKNEAIVALTDIILDCEFVELRHENHLHKSFLLFLITKGNEKFIMATRFALSENVVRKIAFQNAKTKAHVNAMNFNQLNKATIEKDLADAFEEFFEDKVLNILPKITDFPIFIETNRKIVQVPCSESIQRITCAGSSISDDRGNETSRVYLFSEKSLNAFLITNKAKSYCSNEFDIEWTKKEDLKDTQRIISIEANRIAVISKDNVTFFNEKFILQDESILLPVYEHILFADKQRAIFLAADGEVINVQLNQKSLEHQLGNIELALANHKISSHSNKDTDFKNPQSLLDIFKMRSQLKFEVESTRNLIIQNHKSIKSYNVSAQIIDSSSESSVVLTQNLKKDGFNLNIELFVQTSKSNKDVANFITSNSSAVHKQANMFSNTYPKLELKTVVFRGAPISKSHHVSQMLIPDGEYFSTKFPFNLFVFENVFEKIMKIKKVTFKVSESFKQNSIADYVLVFVFNDLMNLNRFVNFTNITPLTLETGIKNGSIPVSSEPCLVLSLKKAVNGTLSEELEMARYGKYVAFLPIRNDKPAVSKNLDCFQYFGVEGEYALENEKELLSSASVSQIKNPHLLHNFEGLNIKVKYNDHVENVKNVSIVAVQESSFDFTVKLRISLPINGVKIDCVELILPSKIDHLKPFAFTANFTNISHPLIEKISDQFEDKSSEKLISIFNIYNQNIIEADFTNDAMASRNFQVLSDLLLLIIEYFGEKSIESIMKLNFFKVITDLILCCQDNKAIGSCRFLIEKLFSFEKSHQYFMDILLTILDNLSSYAVVYEGLQIFWQLLSKLECVTETPLKTQIVNAVLRNFSKSIDRSKTLTTAEIRVLRTFGFPETINGLSEFAHNPDQNGDDQPLHPSSNETSQTPTGYNNFVHDSTLLKWNGFSNTTKNYAEYYLNLTDVVRVSQVLIKFPKIKPLLKTRIEMFFYDSVSEKFEFVKSKLLNEDFVNYLGSKLRSEDKHSLGYYDLGFNFLNLQKLTKLIKIVITVNHIPVYDYSEADSMTYDFFVHGTVVQNLITSLNSESLLVSADIAIKEITTRSNQLYNSTNDELTALSSNQFFIIQLASTAMASGLSLPDSNGTSEKKQDKPVTENNKNDSLALCDDVKMLKTKIDLLLQSVELIDLKNKQQILTKLQSLIGIYQLTFGSNSTSKSKFKKQDISQKFDLENNLTFWISNINFTVKFCLSLLSETNDVPRFATNKTEIRKVIIRLFFDNYFFDESSNLKSTQDLILEQLKLFDAAEIKLIAEDLCAEFLTLEHVSFVSNIDRFFDRIKSIKIQETFAWEELLDKLIAKTNLKLHELDDGQVKEMLLFCKLFNSVPRNISLSNQSIFAKIQSLAIWMMMNELEGISKKFEETILVLIGLIFNFMCPERTLEFDNDSLKKTLVLVSKNGLLSKTDKVIAVFIEGIAKKTQQSSGNKIKQKRTLINLKTVLSSFISENVLENNAEPVFPSEKIPDILFFALSHIKSIDEILENSLKIIEEDNKPGNSSMLSKESISKKSNKVERSSSVCNIPVDHEAGFNTFVADILKFMTFQNIKDNSLISIVTNFSISEQINSTLLFGFIRFTMNQSKDTRQTIIQDLGLRFTEIHKKLKANKNKNAIRDFSSSTIELLVELMKNYPNQLYDDLSLTHFAISITLHVINENENKLVSNEACKLPLKPQLIAPLFNYTITLLNQRFNFGGVDNFQNFADNETNLFELICNCVHIITKGIDDSNSNLLTYFVQNFKNLRENPSDFELDRSLESLAIWSLCNYSLTSPELKSVISGMLKKLHADINFLFSEFFKKEEAAKVLLNSITTNFRSLNHALVQRIERQTLGYQAIYMSENSIDFLESILKYIADNEILANHFLLFNKGLELIFEILHKNSVETSQISGKSAEKSSFIKQLQKIANSSLEKLSSVEIPKSTISPNKDKLLFEEEYGTKITNVFFDKSINNGSNVKDWNTNKIGKNSTVYNTSIWINKKYVNLRFKVSEEFELKTFRLSLTVARSEQYLVVGPSPYIHLYAIQEDEKKEVRRVFLGELKRVNDSSYLQHFAMVYVLNLNKLEGNDYIASLNNLKYARELKEFEVVIAKPTLSVVDKLSQLANRNFSAINLSVNFISIDGFSHTKIDVPGIFRNKIQTSFFKFLEIIFNSDSCSKSIDDYFDSVNRDKRLHIYDLIESQLNPIMQNFDEKMSKFLMTLSEKNKRLADSTFLFLMKNIEKKNYFFFLIERILKKTFSYKYFFEFFDLGRRRLIVDSANLSRFLMVVVNYLTFLASKLEHENKPVKLILPLTDEFFQAILQVHKGSVMNYQIERFLVTITHLLLEGKLYTVFPDSMLKVDSYVIDNSQLKQNTVDQGLQFINAITQRINNSEPECFHLLAFMSLKSEAARKSIIDYQYIEKTATELAIKDKIFSMEVLLFIQCVSEIDELYPILIKNQIDKLLVSSLENQLTKLKFKENQDLINTTLKTIFSLFKKSADQITDLELMLFSMLKRKKDDSFFIEKVLLKFFEFEMTKRVSFNFKKEKEPQKLALEMEEPDNSNTKKNKQFLNIKSNKMPNEYFSKLASQLVFLVDEKTEKAIKSFEWKRIVETDDSTEDFSEKYEPHMYNKKPSMIIISLDNDGVVGYLGLYVPEGFIKYADQTETVAYVPNTDNAFLFYYSEQINVHYKAPLDKCDKFLKYMNYDMQKSIIFMFDNSEKINISMLPDYPSTIDFYQMKPIVQDNNPDFEFPYDCTVNGIEIFQLEVKLDEKAEIASELNNESLMGTYLDKLGVISVPFSMYEESIFYELPNQLAFKALKKVVPFLSLPDDLKDKTIEEAKGNSLKLSVSKETVGFNPNIIKNEYNPFFPVFEVFIQKGGIRYVIESIKRDESLTFLKEKNVKDIWRQLMDDLLDLQEIDGFLSSMTQNKDFLMIIFELFIGSSTSKRNWEESEFTISNLIFEKLAMVLKNTNSISTRFLFFEKNVLRKLLDKLRGLSYENVRTFLSKKDEVIEVLKEQEKVDDKDEPLLKEIKKRKGVGYEKEGSGKKWIVNEYLAKKKLRNDFIVSLLKLFKNLFTIPFDSYLPNDATITAIKEGWFRTIAESCLLPLLEGSFKCSSLHEMSKEYDVYNQYCEILETISKNTYLKPLLLQLPADYVPLQLESVITILKKQEENTNLFKSFAQSDNIKSGEKDDKLQSIELGNQILETIEKIKKEYPTQFEDDNDEDYENITENDLKKIMELPVNDMYKISFKNLRFDLVDFKKSGDAVYDHHYSSNISSDLKSSSQSRMVRLAQEIADLSSSLPIDSYNAITVRADVNRLDVIKSMIAGAENTPYANGLFEYHVYLPSDYPSGPPKCNLETTGSGDVRFNPNLYACGKVCLSLLGTWRGTASENWDPKISNLLQLFLSIQSVVMSEEVYFNEPGYEGEAGTEEGEKKNEGYSNIVRLNNIKYAMIKQIKSPVIGFEEVTRRHFFIKRHVILKECTKWVKYGEVRQATYSGLVSDHNNKYASKFQSNAKGYLTELKTAITELEKTLKELVESCDPHTIFANKRLFTSKHKAKPKKKKVESTLVKTQQEKIDTTYDEFKQFEKFDAEDKKVADRWSRYIGAMGIEAVKKQATAKVVIIGLNVLGLEIAKNIVLSGVNTLTLVDWRNIEQRELLGNFYASPTDVGHNRAEVVKGKIQQLNFYVKVEHANLDFGIDFISTSTVIIITDNYLPKTSKILEMAAEKKIKIIIAENIGVYSRVFVDFGNEFVVNDRDGEDPSECYIKDINHENNTITLFEKSFNQLRDGDFIVFSEVESEVAEDKTHEPNGSIHKIKSMRKITEIEVEDLSKIRKYVRNGKIKELKVPLHHKFVRYSELNLENHEKLFDENLQFHDFMKMENIPLVSKIFLMKEIFEKSKNVEFKESSLKDIQSVFSEEQLKDEKLMKKLALVWATSHGSVHSLNAFIGGLVSQETIIGITGKYTPIKQLFVTDIEDILNDDIKGNPESYDKPKINKIIEKGGKYGQLELLIGEELMTKIKNSSIFMVGAGAIGCELLKNCSMIGIGSGKLGSITLTDPDSIELSNLNRQFLFREKHISKPKSFVAASVIQTMNTDYKDQIMARLDKVCDESEDVFDDAFFKKQTICLNALDNIKARVYMDQRCVKNSVPLLESGTLGPKGHVQVILPNQTENYSQVRDANEEHNIPVCTLKIFPEEPIHCMEWAKDRFEVLFSQNPQSLIRVLEEFQNKKDISSVDLKLKKSALKQLIHQPKTIGEAIELSRSFYQKSFVNKIKQLMHVYPLDYKTKEGKMFWTLPKRPPTIKEFSYSNIIDKKFVESYSRLLCRIWGVDETMPSENDVNSILSKIVFEEFKPKDSDIKKIKKDVEKMEKKDEKKEQEEKEEEDASQSINLEVKINEQLNKLLSDNDPTPLLKMIKPEVFEKDNDENSNIDFIHSLTSLRSQNYKLGEMDWMSVKIKAGRIVPALATTTATIAALQTIEAIKVIKNNKLDEFKNCFLNLAIPTMTLSEPGPAMKHKIHETLTVTVWDQWVYEFTESKNHLFADFISYIEKTYKIVVIDIMKDNKPIFLAALNNKKLFEKVKLSDLFELDKGETCYASVICKLTAESEKTIQNLPIVKVVHK